MNPIDLLRSISDAYFVNLKSKATTVFGRLGVDFLKGGIDGIIPDIAGYVPVGGVMQFQGRGTPANVGDPQPKP